MSKDNEVRPFLIFASQPTRTLGAALPAIATPEVTSPWLPRPAVVEEVAQEAPPPIDVEAIAQEARERGRAEGLAETEALRAQLTEVIDALVAARAALAAANAETIADVCGAVIEAWTDTADRAALFQPMLQSWLAAGQPAAVRAHPSDLDALADLIGDAPLTVTADEALAPGAIAIRGEALEANHDWRARLPELRTAIAAAIGART